MEKSKEQIINEVKEYMNSIGLKEYTNKMDSGEYAIYISGSMGHECLKLVFRQKGNKKLIDYFTSQGWNKGKSYRNYTGSPSMFKVPDFGIACSTGVFMATMEYPFANIKK